MKADYLKENLISVKEKFLSHIKEEKYVPCHIKFNSIIYHIGVLLELLGDEQTINEQTNDRLFEILKQISSIIVIFHVIKDVNTEKQPPPIGQKEKFAIDRYQSKILEILFKEIPKDFITLRETLTNVHILCDKSLYTREINIQKVLKPMITYVSELENRLESSIVRKETKV